MEIPGIEQQFIEMERYRQIQDVNKLQYLQYSIPPKYGKYQAKNIPYCMY